jgi:hypothetical protein
LSSRISASVLAPMASATAFVRPASTCVMMAAA